MVCAKTGQVDCATGAKFPSRSNVSLHVDNLDLIQHGSFSPHLHPKRHVNWFSHFCTTHTQTYTQTTLHVTIGCIHLCIVCRLCGLKRKKGVWYRLISITQSMYGGEHVRQVTIVKIPVISFKVNFIW